MAAPVTTLPVSSGQPGVDLVYHKVTFGAATAIGSQSSNSGVTVSKAAAGRINVDIDAPVQSLLHAEVLHQAQSAAGDFNWHVYTPFVASTRRVVLSNSPGGTETSPTSGDSILLCLHVKRESTGFDL